MIDKQEIQKEGFFKDAQGHTVLWQWPNLPLYGWIVFRVLSAVAPTGHLKVGAEQLSTALLFTWAFLEAIKGVNYFRRLLGVIVLIALIASFFK